MEHNVGTSREPMAMEHNVGASREQRRSRDNGAIRAMTKAPDKQRKRRREKEGAECGEKTRSAAAPTPILIPVSIF
jgi:hypothetical protein